MIVFNEVMYVLYKTGNFINVAVIYKDFNSRKTFGFNLISGIVDVGFSPATAFSCVPGEKIPSLFLSHTHTHSLFNKAGGGEMV
jgi:hypothetical protein